MTGKLDQSLDTILAARKKNARPRRSVRRPATGAKPATTPVGGVKKATRPAKKVEKAAIPTGPARSESKIMVSNLPADVNEAQVKEYFQKTVGSVKRIFLSYGPNGKSRGVATVVFGNAASAAKAVKDQHDILVDGKPMKVEVILDGKDAPAPPGAKKLADRVTQPKSAAKPKPATEAKTNKATKKGQKPARGQGKRPGGRVKKTAEELDAEMTDYFQQGNQNGAANGASSAAATAAAGDTNMADDI